MRRLLWKEIRETLPLMLALIGGPLFMLVVLGDRNGLPAPPDQQPGPFWSIMSPSWVAEIIAAVLGASLASEELKRGRFSVLYLPVPRWRTFLVKFLMGVGLLLIGTMYLPMLYPKIAQFRFHDNATYTDTLLALPLKYFGRLLVVYCLAFMMSLLTTSATGALAGFICGLILNYLWGLHSVTVQTGAAAFGFYLGIGSTKTTGWIGYHSLVQRLFVLQVIFAAFVTLAGFLVWRGGVTRSAKWRAAWGLAPAVLLMVFMLPVRGQPMRQIPNVALPSPDGKQLAYTLGPGGSAGHHSSEPMMLMLAAVLGRQQHIALSSFYISPIAWSPDAKSLFVETRAQHDAPSQIMRIEVGGKSALIASLPLKTLSLSGRVTPDGRYLVMRWAPSGPPGFDLWAIDLRDNSTRVIAPNMGPGVGLWAHPVEPVWDRLSDQGVITAEKDPRNPQEGARAFREIALDGSGVRRRWSVR